MITEIGPESDHSPENYYGDPIWDRRRPVVPVVVRDEGVEMLSYPETWRKIQWGVVMPFTSRMQLVSYTHGRSAMNFTMRAEDGTLYPVPLTDFMWLVENDTMVKGLTESHTWFAKKRGANYLLGIEGVSKP